MAKPKVFVDSSVLISATLSSQGGSFYILANLYDYYQFLINEYILEESLRILHEKFSGKFVLLKTFFYILGTSQMQILNNPSKGSLHKASLVIEAPDTPILAAACKQADYLITLDQDFLTPIVLAVAKNEKLTILKPKGFIELYRKDFQTKE